MVGNRNPYRIEDYNFKGGSESSSTTHNYSSFNCSNLIPPSCITQTLQIKAHTEKIGYVSLVNEAK